MVAIDFTPSSGSKASVCFRAVSRPSFGRKTPLLKGKERPQADILLLRDSIESLELDANIGPQGAH